MSYAKTHIATYGAVCECGKRHERATALCGIRTQNLMLSGREINCKRCRMVAAQSAAGIIPTVKEAIASVEAAGWKFSHRSIIRTYVFYNERLEGQFNHELAFTLTELRDAYRYGF